MRTVSKIDLWFEESAKGLIGRPVADAVHDVMTAELPVEVSRPDVRRIRDHLHDGVTLVIDRRGVVVDVLRPAHRPIRASA